MLSPDHDITYLARVDFRTDRRPFGIHRRDRRSHLYVIGKTGTGKSTLLRTMLAQDIARGEGAALFDPHGDLVRQVRELVPPERQYAKVSASSVGRFRRHARECASVAIVGQAPESAIAMAGIASCEYVLGRHSPFVT